VEEMSAPKLIGLVTDGKFNAPKKTGLAEISLEAPGKAACAMQTQACQN